MTVWCVNSNKMDTSQALEYGDIRHINTRYVYGDEITDEQMPLDVRTGLHDAARRFDFHKDYVLIAGDHLQLVFFMKELGLICGGLSIHVLRYDKMAEGYIPVWV